MFMSQNKEKTQRKPSKQFEEYRRDDPKRDKKRKNDYSTNRQYKRNLED